MKAPTHILEAISKNKLVCFVGAGLSIKFNLPSWSTLVEAIINKSGNSEYKNFLPILNSGLMKPTEILERLQPEHQEIKRYIKNNFKISTGDFSTHANILKLTNQVITTNFDNAFEMASDNKITPAIYTSDFNISEINKSNDPYIFKLHGSYTEPDHCIIFYKDYEELYTKETAAKEKLKSIFAEKTILFIGFSFSDPDINLIFENLDKAFGNNNKHYLLTKDPSNFKTFKFLEIIELSDYSDIDLFINDCLVYKLNNTINPLIEHNTIIKQINKKPRVALLSPNPIDIKLNEDLSKIPECFDLLDIILFLGTLNIKTLEILDDYDIIIIVSQVFKNKLYIEDDNLKSNLLSASEICSSIPNVNIPIIFITNEKIELNIDQPTINISTLKRSVIKRFIYKALRERKLDFNNESDVSINLLNLGNIIFEKGEPIKTSLYNNNRNLDIGKKCLTNVIGRIEEQASIALKLLSIYKTNKLLNIKASGGTGKTTIIKKVAYELYNRGYYNEGVNFKSCESVKTYADLEEILIDGFNLTNILNFKDYLTTNFSTNKLDLLIILDNFESVVTALNKTELIEALDLLKFATDFANIVVTSREKLTLIEDFEDVFSLTPLITDDAYMLFEKYYGAEINEAEIKILRQDILEDLLNNNPLAIKLVTKSRTSFRHISELKDQIKEHFFESINEDYTLVFKNNANLNIERTKSIYQSINYSYATLTNKEKIAFELLSLFPDGISLTNFKKCYEKSTSSNSISDRELRVLRDKSLVEDYNGTLQLQPIIRRFADHQLNKRTKEVRKKYYLDAYIFNGHILELIEFIEHIKSTSEALKIYNNFKNNLLNALSYFTEIEIMETNSSVPEKKYLLHYICKIDDFIVNEKQITEFHNKLLTLKSFFSDLPNAEILLDVLDNTKTYYFKEFDSSYKELSKFHSVEEMEKRIFKNEDYIENMYKNIISLVHDMEGNTVQRIRTYVQNDDISKHLGSSFFYLGILNNVSRKRGGFYYFEYELMLKKLNISELEEYINSLHSEQHLEIMQSTYTLSKVKQLDIRTIQKTVVTNPYTKGLKKLMFAFLSNETNEKKTYFEEALLHLSHIKYYYIEALYYYCLFLSEINSSDFKNKLSEGIKLCDKFKYLYLSYLFKNIENPEKEIYQCNYEYYQIDDLETYVIKHNNKWEKEFNENHWE